MNPIEPRFEFRVFDQDFGRAIEAIMRSSPQEEQDEGTQTYLFSPFFTPSISTANPLANPFYSVKIRDGKLDVKMLGRTYQMLEYWHPYLRLAFPLTSAFLHEFFFAWLEIAPPRLQRERYTEEQFFQELILPNPQVRAVQLHKQRRHYQIGGCQLEMASLWVEYGHHKHTMQSVAVESTEPGTLLRMIQFLQLQHFANTSYSVALSQLFNAATGHRQPRTALSKMFMPANAQELVLAR